MILKGFVVSYINIVSLRFVEKRTLRDGMSFFFVVSFPIVKA